MINIARGINRRTFLRRAATTVFGVVAGMSVGVPRALAAFPCGGLPNCRSTSSVLCRGSTCAGDGTYSKCSPYNTGCSSAGHWCWSSGGGKCCDCTCSYYSAGHGRTIHCICYG